MTKTKWESISIEEKESIINFDYFEGVVNVYTTNQSTGNRIKKKIGEPDRTQTNQGQIYSMEWKIPFNDREKIRKGLSIVNFITTHQSLKKEEALSNETE